MAWTPGLMTRVIPSPTWGTSGTNIRRSCKTTNTPPPPKKILLINNYTRIILATYNLNSFLIKESSKKEKCNNKKIISFVLTLEYFG